MKNKECNFMPVTGKYLKRWGELFNCKRRLFEGDAAYRRRLAAAISERRAVADRVMMKSYDPNTTFDKFTQHVEITLQQWEYSGTLLAEVGGNTLGFSIMEFAIENAYDALALNHHKIPTVWLFAPDGGSLECSDDEEGGAEWLKNMVVEIRIISQTEIAKSV